MHDKRRVAHINSINPCIHQLHQWYKLCICLLMPFFPPPINTIFKIVAQANFSSNLFEAALVSNSALWLVCWRFLPPPFGSLARENINIVIFMNFTWIVDKYVAFIFCASIQIKLIFMVSIIKDRGQKRDRWQKTWRNLSSKIV